MKRGLLRALLCLFVSPHAFAATISNTASVAFTGPDSNSYSFNSNTLSTTVIPDSSPAVISFLRYTPMVTGSESQRADGTQCFNGSSYQAAPTPTTSGGSPIDTSGAIDLSIAAAFRAGEPLFLKVSDANRNVDPLLREFVIIELTTTDNDKENLRLQETGVNTGVFVGAMNSRRAPPASSQFDCELGFSAGTRLALAYVDSYYGDSALANILIDPYGVVFNSSNGQKIDGVRVSVINVATGLGATVFDDDGVTPYPNTMLSGGTAISGANTYQMPPGGYRFPLMPPGTYRLQFDLIPANFTAPTNVPLSVLDDLIDSASGLPFSLETGYLGDPFTLVPGPPLHIDIPMDPNSTDLILSKTTSKSEVSTGDFVRYELLLRNVAAFASTDVVLNDVMPPGFRFAKGSLRIDDKKVKNPSISDDGRSLQIPLGTVAIAANHRISYVAEVSAGAHVGLATNVAFASRSNGDNSNTAQSTVQVKDAFFASHAVLMGRVMESETCDFNGNSKGDDKMKGAAKIKVLMEDGTYVATDDEGRFHFEKVTPGTHVVQVDESSLPRNMELVECDKNTRSAGRANSQFVDVQGGTLWKTNFYLRQKKIPQGAVDVKYTATINSASESEVADALFSVDIAAKEDVKNLKFSIQLPKDFVYLPMSGGYKGKVLDAQLENGLYVFRVPNLAKGEREILTLRAISQGEELLSPISCLQDQYISSVAVNFTLPPYEGEGVVSTQTPTCDKPEVKATENRIDLAAPKPIQDEVVLDDAAASGAGRNWVQEEAPGRAILFPLDGYNPRAPSSRVVVKHGPGQKVDLRINGEPVSKLNFENTTNNGDKTVYVSEWKGVPLKEGNNHLEAGILNSNGEKIEIFKRVIRYSNIPEKIVLVPEKSRLLANGVEKPRIVIRVLAKDGKAVRKGVRGTYKLNDPYTSAQFEEFSQKRQLSALDKFEAEYIVSTDDGLAYIDLAATDKAGEVRLEFLFPDDRIEELNTWLSPDVQDWVVVGFAEGTAGYNTLKGNMQDLPGADKNKELDTDGQVKLYAKGRVSGEWILTVAADTTKEKQFKETNFKGIIDPSEFYTLYGDATTQKNDAASSEKIYIKIEKSRFYALFGDYDAGLNETELARYNRSFTGIKSEYDSKFVGFKLFGAQQDSRYFKEEIQGRGDSLNFRLAKGGILVNSEKIRLVVRDRYRSDKIISESSLSRHIDYTINYSAGTVNFKKLIASEVDFNPQFVVVEYETLGTATTDYTYGGRVEGRILDQKLKVGVSHIHEDDGTANTNLQAVDVTVKLADQSELVLEGAQSDAEPNGAKIDGKAYRAELDHRSTDLDANVYVKRTEENFGIGQEAASENGSFKAGVSTSIHLSKQVDINTKYDHQEQLTSDQTQDVASAEVEYTHEKGSMAIGYKRIDERRVSGEVDADQGTAKVSQRFFDNKLELQFAAEQNLNSSQSPEFPNRYIMQAGYRLTDKTRLIAAQEYSDGSDFDTSTTRVGFESDPWVGAKLGSTINQSVSEAGPRTFSTMGLSQSLPIGKQWTFDAAIDANVTFREEGPAQPLNPDQPLPSGGILSGAGYTEDYLVTAGGLTYRAEPWTWNIRLENRMGEIEDKTGARTNLIRELSKGVVLATTHEYFQSKFASGTSGKLWQGDFSLAYRPLESKWTILDRIKYRYETVDNAASLPIFGQTTLKGVDNAVSSALVNNFNLNRLSAKRKNQFSLYYGAKVAWDKYDGKLYQSFTDLWGFEMRHDITTRWDVGAQASVLHSWTADNMKYSYGPSVGWTPLVNNWVSLGYNFAGFRDRDFDAARYTSQGIYLKMRVKFDEKTLGLKK